MVFFMGLFKLCNSEHAIMFPSQTKAIKAFNYTSRSLLYPEYKIYFPTGFGKDIRFVYFSENFKNKS